MTTRRKFLQWSSCLPAGLLLHAPRSFAKPKAQDDWRTFEVIYDVNLAGSGRAHLWIPIPISGETYQNLLSSSWEGNAEEIVVTQEPVYGAASLYARWAEGAVNRQLKCTLRVETRDRATDFGAGHSNVPANAGEDVSLYLRPTKHMPIDDVVSDTAKQITAGLIDPLEKAHAIYEWIVENTFRDPKVEACGIGDIRSMLVTGNLRGKCADINALFVGLARAIGIPSREVYGLRVSDSIQFASLGKSGDVSKGQHCRAEFYHAGLGWVPVDPADVRKVVLEENLSLKQSSVQELRKRLFGSWEMNWVAYNRARDFHLKPEQTSTLNYFMYPYAESASGKNLGFHPKDFVYSIDAKEI